MKIQGNTILKQRGTLSACTLIGFIIGFFVLHPFTMIIYWLEFNGFNASTNDLFSLFIKTVQSSFELSMLRMGILFGSIFGFFGYLIGYFVNSINSKKYLKRRNQQLVEFENLKLNFLKMISHEVRTPLNGIVGGIDILKSEDDISNIKEVLLILEQSSSRLESFLLTAVKITEYNAGITTYKNAESNVIGELQKIKNALSVLATSKNINIKLENNLVHKATVNIHPELFETCLKHIIENAILHSNSEVIIQVNPVLKKKLLEVIIMDDGLGFEESNLKNIFSIFSTSEYHTDSVLGLNFPLSKLICESHDGSIEVRNHENGGAMIKTILACK